MLAVDASTPTQRDARFRQELRGRATDLKPAALALVPLNCFTELKRPNMTGVDSYLLAKRGMELRACGCDRSAEERRRLG